ncbi:MAG: hypothetical protein AABX74_05000 [Nanoarchaeota archaeon]
MKKKNNLLSNIKPKKNSSLIQKITFSSFIFFYLGLILSGLVLYLDFELLGVFRVVPIIMFIAMFTLIISVIIILYRGYKEIKKDKSLEIPYFFAFWKWLNIIWLFGYAHVALFNLISGGKLLALHYDMSLTNIPTWITTLSMLISFIAAIGVVYGVIKKKLIGYYSSLVQIWTILIYNLLFLIQSRSILELGIALIPTTLYGIFAYYIYKGKSYFLKK